MAHYNFCRVHGSLRVTRAIESGLTDHVWTLDELVQEAVVLAILLGLAKDCAATASGQQARGREGVSEGAWGWTKLAASRSA